MHPLVFSNYYRADIDGLRAIAVLAVVLFHAFPEWLPGGFIGVDIFFVISGFLISGIIFRELDSGTFRLRDFYVRRVRRIFPSLIVVLAAVGAAGWWLLFNDEYKQLGNHLWRAVLFVINFALWRESGYFDAAAESKPLLHLWSLAIEEQFYLLWPLILMLLAKGTVRRWRGWCILALTLGSLMWCIYLTGVSQPHGFYSPVARFWELMLGALVAHLLMCRDGLAKICRSGRWNAIAPAGALGVLALSMIFFSGDLAFPGGWALIPAFATAVLLHAVGRHWGTGLLSSRWLVQVGLISFPLYLWHWPLLSMMRIVEGQTPSFEWRAVAVALSVFLALLTYRLVEYPLRFHVAPKRAVGGLCLAMAALLALGLSVHKSHGFPHRAIMDPSRVSMQGDIGHDSYHDLHVEKFYPCADEQIRAEAGTWRGHVRCYQSHPGEVLDGIVIGDSHAEHLFLGLAEQVPDIRWAFYGKGRAPLVHEVEFNAIFERALLSPAKVIVIGAFWKGRLRELPAGATLDLALQDTIRMFEDKGKQVYVLDDVPTFPFDPQRCKFTRPLSGSATCDIPRRDFDRQQALYLPALRRALANSKGATLLHPAEALCDEQSCRMGLNGRILYRDTNHLNADGSRLVAKHIISQFRGDSDGPADRLSRPRISEADISSR